MTFNLLVKLWATVTSKAALYTEKKYLEMKAKRNWMFNDRTLRVVVKVSKGYGSKKKKNKNKKY